MRPCEVREEWVRLAGDAFDNAPREQGDHALRGPMAHALAAVLPLAVAEERERCAKVAMEYPVLENETAPTAHARVMQGLAWQLLSPSAPEESPDE